MEKLGLNEIRERFLSFFESKGHLRLPSFSLIPQNDASLLLINSGMAPLKPYFTGKMEPPRRRVTTCQKCIRTPDIENVGKTARHGTFFEMLGNFSFGDYFKEEVIPWAWEFLTEDLKLPRERLYVSVYKDDDEAYEIWNKKIGLPPERIFRMGKEDNFWEIGTGPCGPCSEIYFDRGPEKGCGKPDCTVGCDCDRFVEFWNLVFTQFDKDDAGNYNRLAHPNIDTGMGLERLACIMQDVNNLFEVDTIRNIITYICDLAGVKYGDNEKTDVSIRVITDHIRGTVHLISDGVTPSNEGRGYVLRRLIRRAARHGKLLNIDGPFLYKVAEVTIRESENAYPQLRERKDIIQKVIRAEEERFSETLQQGLDILSGYIDELKKSASGGKTPVLSGKDAFRLYDTYGFPLDMTRDILEEAGIGLDEEGFNEEMNRQREMARAAIKDQDRLGWDENIYSRLASGSTKFVGYGKLEHDAEVLAIVEDDQEIGEAGAGKEVHILLDETVFYGESGGQVGDTGVITFPGGMVAVTDAKKMVDGKIVHYGRVEEGTLKKGAKVHLKVDEDRRRAISRNHSATHLLHKALRNTLGNHVAQSGSLVQPDRLRFDFSHFTAVTPEELLKVEDEVNKMILRDLEVKISEVSIDEARKMGAMALFEEKYGDVVRLVKMGDYSLELCGGCHVSSTSQIGLFHIVSESGVAAGVRRIEAVTGEGYISFARSKEAQLDELTSLLKVKPEDATRRIEQLLAEVKTLEKEIAGLKKKLIGESLDDILNSAREVDGIKLVTAKFEDVDMESLRNTGDTLRSKLGSGVVVLGSVSDGKVNFVAMVTKDLLGRGVHAGNLVRETAKIAGGGGGGRPDMAQAGGKDPSRVDEALSAVARILSEQIKK